MPALTNSSNSLSVIPGNGSRICTPATPSGVFTSKAGRSARVAGEPVQAARLSNPTSASATLNARARARQGIHADMNFHTVDDASNLPYMNTRIGQSHG